MAVLIAYASITWAQTAVDSGGAFLRIGDWAYPEILVLTNYANLVGCTAVTGP